MATTYKVWLSIEKYDTDTEEGTTIGLADKLMEFEKLNVANQWVAALLQVIRGFRGDLRGDLRLIRVERGE